MRKIARCICKVFLRFQYPQKTSTRLLIILFVVCEIFQTFFFNILQAQSNPTRRGTESVVNVARRLSWPSATLTSVNNPMRTGCGFPRTYRINYRYAEARRLARTWSGADGREGIVNESIKRSVCMCVCVCVGQDRVHCMPCVYAPSLSIVFSPILQPHCIWNSA